MTAAVTRIQKYYKARYRFNKLRFVVDKVIHRKKLEKEQAEITRQTEIARVKAKSTLDSGIDHLFQKKYNEIKKFREEAREKLQIETKAKEESERLIKIEEERKAAVKREEQRLEAERQAQLQREEEERRELIKFEQLRR